tara:strand:- start:271 stop:603 length:333 start_codon:yes stop_codon:yes gene_type:complete
MIKNLLKNICIISFALIGPITLPAGGIQRNLNKYEFLNNSKEIILISNCPVYTYPKTTAKELIVMNSGSPLLILQKWKDNEKDYLWLRVELGTNQFVNNPNKVTRGWIKV